MTTNVQYPRVTKQLISTQSQIGRTPLIPLDSLSTPTVKIFAKAEWMQLGQSVKARAAFSIISSAWKNQQLQNKILLDASSGNTAIAYASILSRLKIPLEICLPKNASPKRKAILRAFGATLHLTSELEGTDGAQSFARSLNNENPGKYFYADQYNNPANIWAHQLTTAPEIWSQTKGKVTHFIAGLGTTGSFVGTSKTLKNYNTKIKAVALQPDSPLHFLEGWKHLSTAIVPGIYSEESIDEKRFIDSGEAMDMVKFVAKNEGILISPSSGANLLGAHQLSKNIKKGNIVTLLPDDISKYDDVLKTIAS